MLTEKKFWSAIHNEKWKEWSLTYGESIVPFSICVGDQSCEEDVMKIVDLLNADDNDKSLLTAFICLACDVDGPL